MISPINSFFWIARITAAWVIEGQSVISASTQALALQYLLGGGDTLATNLASAGTLLSESWST